MVAHLCSHISSNVATFNVARKSWNECSTG
ncbi:unnamed protein product [Spirodela intermedia]|uniref:Uncharacterized protein n=1 Tax=Spirodela intermedia TaxID=51605 RepID=A0A7I8IYU7_SPIIN|nr:unnamed protein product [Spirodela intermedia]CAA6663166.1 unnamed protein product [Spirodela intermedia]